MVGNRDNAYGSLQKAVKEKYKDIYDTQKELIQQSIEAVSYTHLDVYKRQAWATSNSEH